MSPSEPPLTVVITSHNREGYLGTAIESVLNSRYENFKLLVLDDASTDGTAEVARSWAGRDRRVELVVNDENLGDYANRNRAIELVTSPFLKYHDSDDLLYPHGLGTMMRLLVDEPRAGFALSSGNAWSGGPCPMFLTPRMAYQREYLGHGLFACGPSGALFRTSVLRELGGFIDFGVGSDYCFWLRACAVTPIVLAPADLFWYRVHLGQEFQSDTAARDYAVAQGHGWRALSSSDCPLEGEELQRARRKCTYSLLKLSWWDFKSGRWPLIAVRLRSAGIGWRDWLEYPPQGGRDRLAGTPLTENGDYLVPEWLRVSSPPRPASDEPSRDAS